MAVRPISIPVTVKEGYDRRPAKSDEVLVEIAWGSMPWQHLSVKTGGDGIAVWDRKEGATGFGSNWYHITAMLDKNHAIRADTKMILDDAANTYYTQPWTG